ncbi:MAG: SRPBCC domain-containing protein [Actinomycetota bacterium]|nr:SRPBCC domain-containing protein [Actinomycetota bacterium]
MSHELRLERTFDAGPDVVFDVFLDPDAQRALFADGPDWIVESELDLRVGGTWTLVFGPSRSQLYREVAVFSEVDRPRRLAYVVTATFEDGQTFDTEIEITFEEKDGQTNMALIQTGYPSIAMRDDFKAGWTDLLNRLEPVVEERAAGGVA